MQDLGTPFCVPEQVSQVLCEYLEADILWERLGVMGQRGRLQLHCSRYLKTQVHAVSLNLDFMAMGKSSSYGLKGIGVTIKSI